MNFSPGVWLCSDVMFLVVTLPTQFVKRAGCYLDAPYAGGKYDNAYDAETCGQLCINDGCCASFSSGNGVNNGDCYLAYISASSNPPNLNCDATKEFDYYERIRLWYCACYFLTKWL